MEWFDVSKEGLALLSEDKAAAIIELLQNAFDEEGVTAVSLTLVDHPKRGRSLLTVTDDAPEGFADLSHAVTLFAPSAKVTDPTKRGRFNLGEKVLLALCDSAAITSTTGGWRFTPEGRFKIRTRRPFGSKVEAVIRLTGSERVDVLQRLTALIPPFDIATTINGEPLAHREPVRDFSVTLPTVLADADGILRSVRRLTDVRLYEVMVGETPHLYEMGIPVVEHDGRWHVDIAQKVPLNMQRDNVTPGYLREVRVAVLNHTHDLISADDATQTWVKEAASDKRAEVVAVGTVLRQRFGDRAVAYDPSDPDANAEAVLQGYTVVPGGSLSGDEWTQAKRAGALQPAGRVTPSNSKVETSPDGIPPIGEDTWTPGHRRVAEYAQGLAKDLLGVSITVTIYSSILLKFDGAYRPGALSFNQGSLGRVWFDHPNQHLVDALLIHEFAHHKVSDHLSEAFHQECCRLGALLRDTDRRL